MGYNPKTGLYTIEPTNFVNTNEFIRSALYFKKHGYYTKAHPKYDKRDYDQYWDEEERRRRYGYSVGGVTITGEHYGFLNFAQIQRTINPDDTAGVIKNHTLARKVGHKAIDFPDFWDGHYHWFRAKRSARKHGLHLLGGKSRRKGFSYVGAWSAANNADLHPGKTTVIGAFDNKYLIRGNGTMSMARKYLDFINKYTAWRKGRLINTKDTIKLGYKLRGRDEEYGYLSEILALSFKDNADASAGKDIWEVDLEELGVFPNLSETLDILLPTLEDGDTITGQFIGWGTGGTKNANWEAFEEIFYNPLSKGCMAFDNIWDEGGKGTSVGFFFPYVQNLVPYMDKNGNSDIKTATEVFNVRLEKQKTITKDASSFLLWKGQRANCPADAFSRSSANIFTSPELSEHIRRVKNDPDIKYLARVGTLIRGERGIRLATNEELIGQRLPYHLPLSYPNKNDDWHGAFVEWQPPYRDPKTGIIPKGLYRVWNDPYAVDKNNEDITMRDSMGATYVYERVNPWSPSRGDILVACYVGRPGLMDTYNEQLLRICEYYGGYDRMCMFENDRGDVKPFFKAKGKINLLADEPEITWKTELQSKKTGRTKGININTPRKGNGVVYFRDWLYTPRGVDSEGNMKLNLHYIYDLPLLLELEKWNLKGNFDRVSAMIVGMFDMKEEFSKEITAPQVPNEHDFFNRPLF